MSDILLKVRHVVDGPATGMTALGVDGETWLFAPLVARRLINLLERQENGDILKSDAWPAPVDERAEAWA